MVTWYQTCQYRRREEAGPKKPQRPLNRVSVLLDHLHSGSDALNLTLCSGPAAAWLVLGSTQVLAHHSFCLGPFCVALMEYQELNHFL